MNLKTLTLAEAHAETGISVRQLRSLIDRGQLQGTKLGRMYRVPVTALEALVHPPKAEEQKPVSDDRQFADICPQDRFA